jgi:hypothetical protein
MKALIILKNIIDTSVMNPIILEEIKEVIAELEAIESSMFDQCAKCCVTELRLSDKEELRGTYKTIIAGKDIEIKKLGLENEKLKEQKICEWKVDDPEYNTYKTGCGQYFSIIDGSLKDNGFKYCSYCGGQAKATE